MMGCQWYSRTSTRLRLLVEIDWAPHCWKTNLLAYSYQASRSLCHVSDFGSFAEELHTRSISRSLYRGSMAVRAAATLTMNSALRDIGGA